MYSDKKCLSNTKPKASAKKRNPFTKQQMENAIQDVEKVMSLRKSAMKYNIDRLH